MENRLKTIYVVIGTFSSWDSYHERNLKAFINKSDAENYVEKADRILKAMTHHIEKMSRMQNLDKEEYENMSVDEVMEAQDKIEESDEFKLAMEVWSCHFSLQEFNECKIQELELR